MLETHLPAGRPKRASSGIQIYADLRHRIVTGSLRPLQCLSETDLAASIGVSRTPIREAFGKLEEQGLVEIRPRFGTFVAPILPAAVRSSQFVREALECAAIAEAARRCTPAQLRGLHEILDEQHHAVEDERFIAADDALHRALMTIAGQDPAWCVVHYAKAVLDRVRYLAVKRLDKRQSILAEHQQIVACVTTRDPVGAVTAMRAHLRGVFVTIEHDMAAHPEFFAWGEEGPRPNRHRPRQAREISAAETAEPATTGPEPTP